MNQVDFFILVVVAACALSGARRGLISSAGDIVTLVVGLGVGSLAYPIVDFPLRWFGLPPTVSGPIGFSVVAVAAVVLVGWGISTLAARHELPKSTNRIGGAAFGVVLGVILAAVLVLFSSALPNAAEPIGRSALGRRITVIVPRLHENMESIGLPLPKLVQLPTDYRDELTGMRYGLQFLRVNFTRLDGATCLHCRSGVDFLGYRFSRGTLMSPKFECPECGRTSDGCQTFEGFHAIYGVCPVTLAEEGVRFDCGVWTNGWVTVPHGPCPVCGKEFVFQEDLRKLLGPEATSRGGHS